MDKWLKVSRLIKRRTVANEACDNARVTANGRPVSRETVKTFSRAVLDDINPRDSWRASKAFRRHIAVEMARRGLHRRSRGGGNPVLRLQRGQARSWPDRPWIEGV